MTNFSNENLIEYPVRIGDYVSRVGWEEYHKVVAIDKAKGIITLSMKDKNSFWPINTTKFNDYKYWIIQRPYELCCVYGGDWNRNLIDLIRYYYTMHRQEVLGEFVNGLVGAFRSSIYILMSRCIEPSAAPFKIKEDARSPAVGGNISFTHLHVIFNTGRTPLTFFVKINNQKE